MQRIALLLLSCVSAFAQPVRPFASFVGICQGNPSPDQPQWVHAGWCRHDFSWQQMQPDGPDSWNEAYLAKWQQLILANREQGVETLPVFCYTAVWAARRDAWSFTVGRKRYDVAAFAEGDPKQRTATETDLDTGETQPKTFNASRVPPQDISHWERFVDRVVTELAKPPYNLTYFQIWNEANDSFTGFWVGGMDEYFATIHLPAARVIRQQGGKVVYGGYPCNGSVPHYLAALDRNQAWDTLDVLDLHYFGIAAWDQLHQRLRQDGRELGIWQTEVGFTRSREWVPNNYPRFFYWALTHGWRPDRYKVFQFANWTPDDPKSYGYDKCFLHGKHLSFHGQAFMALADLLDVPDIQALPGCRAVPELHPTLDGKEPSCEAFVAADRIVVALHVPAKDLPESSQLDLPVAADRVRQAVRVDIYGDATPLPVTSIGESIRLVVPWAETSPQAQADQAAVATKTCYVRVDLTASAVHE